jgi:intein-encoded DNA endonuclease-like protein
MDNETLKQTIYDLYWNKGCSVNDVAKLLGMYKPRLLRIMKRLGIPRRARLDGWKLKLNIVKEKISIAKIGKPLIHVDFSSLPNIAYILGVYLGDGYLLHNEKQGYGVGLGTKDECFAEKFARALKDIGLNPYITKTIERNNKPFWRVFAYSLELHNWLKNYKLSTRRDGIIHLNLEGIREIAEKCPVKLIEGFYESEGSLVKHKGVFATRYEVNIWNTSKELLLLIKDVLANMGFEFRFHERHTKKLYYLSLYKQDQIKRFFSTIDVCIEKKKIRI